ncbi:MAG TPA: hypothetical protein VGI97_04380 [Gemmatimonadaceae bacterium]
MHQHDIAVACVLNGGEHRTYEDIAGVLGGSTSTAHAAVARLRRAGILLPDDQKRLNRLALLELLEHGVRYVFPAEPGAERLGVPTAHSAPALAGLIDDGGESYVWASRAGTVRGRAIEPLVPAIDTIAERAPAVYDMLTLVDALRVGRARERELAIHLLRERLHVPAALAL